MVSGTVLVVSVCLLCFGIVSGENESDMMADTDIRHVHVIFMNHLDVGYSLVGSKGYIANILNRYFHVYFPNAITVASQLIKLEYTERFIYTTHPWLVSLFLDCPPNLVLSGIKVECPTAKNVSDFINAVKQGFITWHAGPMNMEFELFDELMNEFGIQLSVDLDKRFGIDREYRTVSQRDVPGTTVAMIPVFKKMGISAMSIGVNPATIPAAVPPVFQWMHGNDSIIMLYHPNGYPNNYGSSPKDAGGLSRQNCHTVPGVSHALCFAFRTDNTGPPSDYKEVLLVYDIVRSQFPNARINASKFEDFIEVLTPYKSKLPVVTKEMGDVWIQGTSSDPLKTVVTRALYRVRSDCFKQGRCSLDDPRVYNASRFMLKLFEHTWGSDGNGIDNINWANEDFYKVLYNMSTGYHNLTVFWDEQRYFVRLALEALGNHSLVKDLHTEFLKMNPAMPDLTGFNKVDKTSWAKCGGFQLQFDKKGMIAGLKTPSGEEWSNLGWFVYKSYNQTDYDEFYSVSFPYMTGVGISKPNLTNNSHADSRVWDPTLDTLYLSADSSKMVAMLSMADPIASTYYGAPTVITLEYMCSQTGLDVAVQWFNKPATRMPENIDFVFMPAKPGYKWWMNKIEELIDPLDVVENGSQRLHGINRGMYYVNDNMKGLELLSPDAPIANILTETYFVSALTVPAKPIHDVNGVAFNMFNNVWETNYIFWYPYHKEETNQKYRFTINFK